METAHKGATKESARDSLWHIQMGRWADTADSDLLAYIRMRESKRTAKWLADAGLLDLRDTRTRFEIRHCRETIIAMPHFDLLREGRTTWATQRHHPHTPTPPPIPAWAKR